MGAPGQTKGNMKLDILILKQSLASINRQMEQIWGAVQEIANRNNNNDSSHAVYLEALRRLLVEKNVLGGTELNDRYKEIMNELRTKFQEQAGEGVQSPPPQADELIDPVSQVTDDGPDGYPV